MKFTTLTFLLWFIAVFGLYWALPGRRSRNALIVVASYFFYGWWNVVFCALLLFSSVVDYQLGLRLDRATSPRVRRLLVGLSLATNLGLLGYFKYANFFVESAVGLANSLGWEISPTRLAIILPVGISFYTFQTLSYTIDIYRGRFHATRDFMAYLAYVSFFPQLVAGPIERAPRLLPQFLHDRSFDPDAARDGLRLMLWGFVKKIVVADRLALVVDAAYADPAAAGGAGMAFATVCFAFQIYCDFSAYSDIARGCARLFGIDLMRNFAFPFFSLSAGEFWRRWHVSLATWLRDYVYVSLGGGRGAPLRVVGNVLITFLLGGLWHGAGANYLVWGALCGIMVGAERLVGFRDDRAVDATPGGEGWLPTPVELLRMCWSFSGFVLGLCFFRAASSAQGAWIVAKIATEGLNPFALWATAAANEVASWMMVAFIALEWSFRRFEHPFQLSGLPQPARWFVYTLTIWITLGLMTENQQPFIYFQF